MEDIERVARAAVAEVSPRMRAAWRATKTVEFKGSVDLVTATDREVETLVAARLRAAFPDHVIVAEEESAAAGLRRPPDDAYAWYLDPLDGTTNFAHGVPQFAISLGLARGAEMLFGIVHDPIRDETFIGRKGQGATLNDESIRVSPITDLNHALVTTGFPYDRRERTDYYVGFFSAMIRKAQDVRRCGSAALDLCNVACGRYDGFWEWRLHPWDIAAGSLIVREAGGAVSDFRGGRFDIFGEQTLASNGHLHDALRTVLSDQLAAS